MYPNIPASKVRYLVKIRWLAWWTSCYKFLHNIALATLQHRLNDLEKVDVHSGEVKFAADYPGFAVKYYSTDVKRQLKRHL